MRSTTADISMLQDELREKRDALYKEVDKIQKEIDNLEIKKFNINDLAGKCIIYTPYPNEKYYMRVQGVKRLFKGPRLIGKLFYMLNEDNSDAAFHCFSSSTIDLESWQSARKNVIVITNEEFAAALDNIQKEIKERITDDQIDRHDM